MASFIGYAPAAHPKLAAIVVLDEPANTYGGTAAAPVFADVMQFALHARRRGARRPADTQYNAARASAAASGTTCTDPAAAAAAGGNCRRGRRPRSAAAAAQRGRGAPTTVPAGGTRPDRCDRADRADRAAGPSGASGPTGTGGRSGTNGDAATMPSGHARYPARRHVKERIRRARATARPPR